MNPPSPKLVDAYQAIEANQIDARFSVLDMLLRARIFLESEKLDKRRFETIWFFADYLAHPKIDRPPAISFLEQSCNLIAASAPLISTDFRLPALRWELGSLVGKKSFPEQIRFAPKNQMVGWRNFYSILLSELEERTIGFDAHIDKCKNSQLRRHMDRLREQYGETFVHCGQVKGFPLSNIGPPFGFRFFVYRFDPLPNGGYVFNGTNPIIAADGFDWIPWLDPPEHLISRSA